MKENERKCGNHLSADVSSPLRRSQKRCCTRENRQSEFFSDPAFDHQTEFRRRQLVVVLEKVAEVENIQISDEKVQEEIAKMAEMYKMEVEKLKELLGDAEKEQMKADMAVQ